MGLSQLESKYGQGVMSRPELADRSAQKFRQNLLRRRPHPLVTLTFAIGLFLIVFGLHTALQQVILWLNALLLAGIGTRSSFSRVLTRAAWSAPWILVYTLVSALLLPNQGGVFWAGPSLPLLGTLALSWHGLLSSLVRGLRLWVLLLTGLAMGRLIRMEDVTTWFSSRFARTSLTLAMVLSFIPNLQAERQRLVELNAVRGALSGNRSLRVRAKRTAVVYQTLLHNALDRAWILAESMHVRGYGGAKRSFYRPPIWRPMDVWSLAVTLGLCAMAVVGLYIPIDVVGSGLAALVSVAYPWLLAILAVTVSVWFGGRFSVTR